jgi:hypothetical protein
VRLVNPYCVWGRSSFTFFQWKGFFLAKVQFSIIGVNFLHHYGLLVDPASNQASNSSPPFPKNLPLQAPALQPLLQASSVDPHSLFMSSSFSTATPLLELSSAEALHDFNGLCSLASPQVYWPLLGVTGLYSHLWHAGSRLRCPRV